MTSNQPSPPKWIDRLFSWFCSKEILETLQGDLYEIYAQRRNKTSKFMADFRYLIDVLDMCRPFAWKGKSSSINFYKITMFTYYIKLAWKNISSQKIHSGIKIGGFSIGIAACILIALFIKHELNHDRQYRDGDQIFRMVQHYQSPEDISNMALHPAPIKTVLGESFPSIELAVRTVTREWQHAGDNQFRPIDKHKDVYEKGFIYADPEILKILEIKMIYGSVDHALSEPKNIVLSKTKADKYFPNIDPVGQRIVLNDDLTNTFIVGGVMEDAPSTSHFSADFIMTLAQKEFWPGEQTSWCCNNYNLYVKLNSAHEKAVTEEKLLFIRDNFIVKDMKESGASGADDMLKYHSYLLQPIQEIYLDTDIADDFQHGQIETIWIFGFIALIILVMACINFVNLSTAKSANKAKEVGLRKVIGSNRSELINQYLTESIFCSFISMTIGAILAFFALPLFNDLAETDLEIPWLDIWFLPFLFIAALIIGILAGLYPALYLSAFQPIDIMRGKLSLGIKRSGLRNSMVIFQFTASIVLIICTIITYQQMQFILNKNLGFDKENILSIQGLENMGDKKLTLKNELLKLSSVKNVAISNFLPLSDSEKDNRAFWLDGRKELDKGYLARYWEVDEDFINTFEMKLVEGTGFSNHRANDSSFIIINQTMAKGLGLENPIGTKITRWNESHVIIGVVDDFFFDSLEGDIEPLAMVLGRTGNIVSVKLNGENIRKNVQDVVVVWDELMPHQAIRYGFVNERFEQTYSGIQKTSNVFLVFALLAIIVSCLGLFALSAFTVEQRSKEINIRKILGADVQTLFGLLTFDFIKLVLLSLLLAIPIGWYAMDHWLNSYTNRITISWTVFVLAGIISIVIALITISTESIKATFSNPAERLRSE